MTVAIVRHSNTLTYLLTNCLHTQNLSKILERGDFGNPTRTGGVVGVSGVSEETLDVVAVTENLYAAGRMELRPLFCAGNSAACLLGLPRYCCKHAPATAYGTQVRTGGPECRKSDFGV